jgi:hypothetical protein
MSDISPLSLNDEFPSGKHSGERVCDVLEHYPSYVVACVDVEAYDFGEDVTDFLEQRKLI